MQQVAKLLVAPTPLLNWPSYMLTKKISGLQIKEIDEPEENEASILLTTITFVDPIYPPVSVMPIFMQKNNPKVGDYLVIADNEFHCISAEEFESNTRLLDSLEDDTHS